MDAVTTVAMLALAAFVVIFAACFHNTREKVSDLESRLGSSIAECQKVRGERDAAENKLTTIFNANDKLIRIEQILDEGTT